MAHTRHGFLLFILNFWNPEEHELKSKSIVEKIADFSFENRFCF